MRLRHLIALALLAASWVPLTVAAVVVYQAEREALVDDVLERLDGIAEVQEARLEELIVSRRREVELVANRVPFAEDLRDHLRSGGSGELAAVTEVLTFVQDTTPGVRRISVLATGGSVVASTDPALVGGTGSTVSPTIRDAAQRPTIAAIARDGDSGLVTVDSGRIVLDGETLGVLVLEQDAGPLLELAENYQGLGRTGETLLGSSRPSGDVFLSPLRFDPTAALVRPVPDDPALPMRLALDGRTILTDAAPDYRGETVLAATRPVPQADLGLVVKIDRSEALAPVTSLRNLLVGVYVATAALAVAVSVVVARLVSRPVDDLVHTATAIQAGERDRRAHRSRITELGSLAGSFNSMTDDLVKTNEELESFVYVSSHDLKTPLRSVHSFAQLLADDYRDTLDDRGRRYLAFLERDAARATELLNDLVSFVQAGRVEEGFTSVDLDEILATVSDRVADQAAAAGVTITVGDLGVVRGNPTMLTELFENLVSNAVKYRAPAAEGDGRGAGAGRVEVSAVSGASTPEEVTVRVDDDGIGVPPEQRAKIFKVFTRLHTDDEYEGTGMGLAICQQIARQHGGGVTVSDSPLGGASFRVRLPRGPAATAPAAPTTTSVG